MEGKRLLRSLSLKNVLSFGPEGMTLEFEPLNVLIGPNGSGKSNLIEILGLLKALPRDLADPINKGGGIGAWKWTGEGARTALWMQSDWESDNGSLLRHGLTIGSEGFKPLVLQECVGRAEPSNADLVQLTYYYSAARNSPRVGQFAGESPNDNISPIRSGFRQDQSIFAQRRDTDQYPAEAYLGDRFSGIRLYRNWVFGLESKLRSPQPVGQMDDFLAEDARNLSHVLRKILAQSETAGVLNCNLRKAYEGIEKIVIEEKGDDFTFGLREERQLTISARRLSDGTLRYLCLLALLCDPTPPPLICIEEPELGLHPDLIPTIAQLLIDASQRTQLIVTTHSTDLISALWEFPEAVVVCERDFSSTTMKRLDPERLKTWLDRYSLGQLWSMGEIGGNRW